jgi:hypothetical protein
LHTPTTTRSVCVRVCKREALCTWPNKHMEGGQANNKIEQISADLDRS